MDLHDRETRAAYASRLMAGLGNDGVVAVATSFIDNSGINRAKSVPLDRLASLAAWGVGSSKSFDRFRFDDVIAAETDGSGPIGDLRIIPDLSRLVVLAAQPGWAWAPADRYQQSGDGHDQCSRLLLRGICDRLLDKGISVKATFEIEWVVSAGSGPDFVAGVHGPGYGMNRLIELSDYGRDLLSALARQGVAIEQFHPEYAAGQFEVSVSAEDPVSAADTSVLIRQTIRAVGNTHGVQTSFSPKVAVPGVGNGGHVHLSLWRDGANLMAGGEGPYGLTADGASFTAGMLQRLPALLAIGAPSPVSYLRLVPSHWAGAYACWGLENREAAVRMVTGSTGSTPWAANVEVKCFDLLANPYLVLAGLLAAGAAGIAEASQLPEPVDLDPAVLSEEQLSSRGIARLPLTLAESTAALAADSVLAEAFGPALIASLLAIRASEIEAFADSSDQQVAAAYRWLH